jgi:hypothetical protein
LKREARKLARKRLGGDVYKQRLARTGEGKSGGYRIIVLFRSGARTFFVYGFAKSDRENLKEVFFLTDKQLDELVATGKYKEL